jgi:hypothetical protein
MDTEVGTSLLRPAQVSAELRETVPGAALLFGARDYAEWSFAGEPTATYQVPRSLSEGAYRSGFGDPELEATLRAAARFASTKAGARDLVRAKCLVDNQGLSPSPLSLLGSLEDILAYLSESPGAALWLADICAKANSETLSDGVAAIVGSAWYAKELESASALLAQDPPQVLLGENLSVGSLLLREVPEGAVVQRTEFPRELSIGRFFIADTEVPRASWEAFLAAEPEWRDTEALLAKGLVTEDYLMALDGGEGVPGVSWYAADAYCQWLTGLLPPSLSAYEVRLPTEAEWEYAVLARPELRNMLGGFWEWCDDPFAPRNFLPASVRGIAELGSPERSLRGGSWVNPGITPATRASLPPASCSPFVSFRPVIALRVDDAVNDRRQ